MTLGIPQLQSPPPKYPLKSIQNLSHLVQELCLYFNSKALPHTTVFPPFARALITTTMAASATQIKSAVHLSVARMVEEHVKELGIAASPSFVAALVELVFNQLVFLGEDLELFAQHAGRSTVNTSDMWMATRKNEALTRALKEYELSLKGKGAS